MPDQPAITNTDIAVPDLGKVDPLLSDPIDGGPVREVVPRRAVDNRLLHNVLDWGY